MAQAHSAKLLEDAEGPKAAWLRPRLRLQACRPSSSPNRQRKVPPPPQGPFLPALSPRLLKATGCQLRFAEAWRLVDASQQSQPNHMKGPCLHPPAAWSRVLTTRPWPPHSSGPGLQSMPSNQRPSHQDHVYRAPTVDRMVYIWALTVSLPGGVYSPY